MLSLRVSWKPHSAANGRSDSQYAAQSYLAVELAAKSYLKLNRLPNRAHSNVGNFYCWLFRILSLLKTSVHIQNETKQLVSNVKSA